MVSLLVVICRLHRGANVVRRFAGPGLGLANARELLTFPRSAPFAKDPRLSEHISVLRPHEARMKPKGGARCSAEPFADQG